MLAHDGNTSAHNTTDKTASTSYEVAQKTLHLQMQASVVVHVEVEERPRFPSGLLLQPHEATTRDWILGCIPMVSIVVPFWGYHFRILNRYRIG